MRMYQLKLILLLFLFVEISSGQVNIEKFRKPMDQKSFSAFINFEGTNRTGNVDVTEVELESNIRFGYKNYYSFIILHGDQGWESGKQYSDEALAHFRQIFNIRSAIQPELFVQTDYNKKRLLDSRIIAGAGLRLRLSQKQKYTFWYGSALMYEVEKLNLDAKNTHPKETKVDRWSNYLSAVVSLSDETQLNWTVYMQPSYQEFSDYRFLSEFSFKTNITKYVGVSSAYRIRYDSDPPDLVKKMDTKLVLGLVFTF